MDPSNLSVAKIRQALQAGETSAVEVVKAYLAEIKKQDKEINAWLFVDEQGALQQAQAIDSKSEKGVLAGTVVGVKDNIMVEGLPCTAGSKILENYKATYDATVIKKLKDAGAIILGKLNLDEFAMGSSGEYSAFGATKNPRNKNLVPGGSSSGPAAAVAANMCTVALGSDTAGSIRQPASFCGIVGLKPTYGAISRFGLVALASSLDVIGPMAKNLEDAQAVYDVIYSQDDNDATTIDQKWVKPILELKGLNIGVPKEFFGPGLEPGVRDSLERAIQDYKKAGANIVEITLPHAEFGVADYQIIMTAEASSNLARYDGIRYGLSKTSDGENENELSGVYLGSRTAGFSKEVRRRIVLGTYVLSAGYYEAYYARAQKVRRLIKNDFDKAFEKVEVILTPTSPTVPFAFGEKLADPVTMYLADIYTVPVNLAGLPAISIPCYNAQELPVGLQLIGKPFEEQKLFAIAKIFQEQRDRQS